MNSSDELELPAFQSEDVAVLSRYANAMTSATLRGWGGIDVTERHTTGVRDIAQRVEEEVREGTVSRFTRGDADLLKKVGEQLVGFAQGTLADERIVSDVQAEAHLKLKAGKEILEVQRKIEKRLASPASPPAV